MSNKKIREIYEKVYFPQEVIVGILEFCWIGEVLRKLKFVCKQWYNVVEKTPFLWKSWGDQYGMDFNFYENLDPSDYKFSNYKTMMNERLISYANNVDRTMKFRPFPTTYEDHLKVFKKFIVICEDHPNLKFRDVYNPGIMSLEKENIFLFSDESSEYLYFESIQDENSIISLTDKKNLVYKTNIPLYNDFSTPALIFAKSYIILFLQGVQRIRILFFDMKLFEETGEKPEIFDEIGNYVDLHISSRRTSIFTLDRNTSENVNTVSVSSYFVDSQNQKLVKTNVTDHIKDLETSILSIGIKEEDDFLYVMFCNYVILYRIFTEGVLCNLDWIMKPKKKSSKKSSNRRRIWLKRIGLIDVKEHILPKRFLKGGKLVEYSGNVQLVCQNVLNGILFFSGNLSFTRKHREEGNSEFFFENNQEMSKEKENTICLGKRIILQLRSLEEVRILGSIDFQPTMFNLMEQLTIFPIIHRGNSGVKIQKGSWGIIFSLLNCGGEGKNKLTTYVYYLNGLCESGDRNLFYKSYEYDNSFFKEQLLTLLGKEDSRGTIASFRDIRRLFVYHDSIGLAINTDIDYVDSKHQKQGSKVSNIVNFTFFQNYRRNGKRDVELYIPRVRILQDWLFRVGKKGDKIEDFGKTVSTKSY